MGFGDRAFFISVPVHNPSPIFLEVTPMNSLIPSLTLLVSVLWSVVSGLCRVSKSLFIQHCSERDGSLLIKVLSVNLGDLNAVFRAKIKMEGENNR